VNKCYRELLSTNLPGEPPPTLTAETAARLIERIDNIRLHAHSYAFIHNLTHGSTTPADLLEFAWTHELQGLNIHIDDGGADSLQSSSPGQLAAFRQQAEQWDLAIHLEVSSTEQAVVDAAVRLALELATERIRVYSRYEGPLSEVLARSLDDLRYMAGLAERHDLYFDFEQHETYKSRDIAYLMEQVDHPRINAFFDTTNMINACEQPMAALRTLAPWIRQVHLKGARRLPEGTGFGQLGVPYGSPEDEMPWPRMLYEMLLLGTDEPQMTCFALEQEVGYHAPAYRFADEPQDPFIPYKEPSQTPFDPSTAATALLNELRLANSQVTFTRSLLSQLRLLAQMAIES
jgi:sugar phosphate isomerase/epimerase